MASSDEIRDGVAREPNLDDSVSGPTAHGEDPAIFMQRTELRGRLTSLMQRVRRLPESFDDRVNLIQRLSDYRAKLVQGRATQSLIDSIADEVNGVIEPDLSALEKDAIEQGLVQPRGSPATAIARKEADKPKPRFVGTQAFGKMSDADWVETLSVMPPDTIKALQRTASASDSNPNADMTKMLTERLMDLQQKNQEMWAQKVISAVNYNPWAAVEELRSHNIPITVGAGNGHDPATAKIDGTYSLVGKLVDNSAATRRELVRLLSPVVSQRMKQEYRSAYGQPPNIHQFTPEQIAHLAEEQATRDAQESSGGGHGHPHDGEDPE